MNSDTDLGRKLFPAEEIIAIAFHIKDEMSGQYSEMSHNTSCDHYSHKAMVNGKLAKDVGGLVRLLSQKENFVFDIIVEEGDVDQSKLPKQIKYFDFEELHQKARLHVARYSRQIDQFLNLNPTYRGRRVSLSSQSQTHL